MSEAVVSRRTQAAVELRILGVSRMTTMRCTVAGSAFHARS